jgi:benzoate/toluate 1,2-dioxygenase reductase subunit
VYSATFLFADDQVLTLSVEDGQTVLEAAMAADAPIRYDCASGACGACVALCVHGEAVTDPGAALPISRKEYAQGLRPTCLSRLVSDARFHLPYPRSPVPSEPRRFKGRVVDVARLCATVYRLVIDLDRAEDLVFQPGQYLRVRPPGSATARAFSIASTPAEAPRVELLIRLVEGGAMGAWLEADAVPGASLTLHGPLGAFGLDVRARRHVFVAGGTGLAPVLSMARALPQGHSGLLCFGCTRREDLFHVDVLAALSAANPAVETRVALIEPGDSGLPEGVAMSLLAEADLTDPDAVFYLCGPPLMVEAARASLSVAGVAPDRIRAERFAIGG